MAYDLLITQAAEKDLDEALEYISDHLANPTAAANLLDKVDACYAQLKEFPFLYERCRDVRLSVLGYHKVVIGNFVLIYHPIQAKKMVYILRFVYGGRDYEKLI